MYSYQTLGTAAVYRLTEICSLCNGVLRRYTTQTQTQTREPRLLWPRVTGERGGAGHWMPGRRGKEPADPWRHGALQVSFRGASGSQEHHGGRWDRWQRGN